MSEWNVEVVRIGAIEKHPNADTLSITMVHDGYPCIIRSGDFAEGDLAVYVPVDSIVPDVERWKFLNGNRRIKAKRLRGVFSMGLLTPIEPGMSEGDAVAEVMDITKYEPPLTGTGFNGGVKEPQDPRFDPGNTPEYTDIEGYRRHKSVLVEGEQVACMEKVHGCVPSSAQIHLADGTHKAITKLSVGDEVLGVDESGNVVATPIIRKYENGKADRWMCVRGKRRAAGRGAGHFSLKCTPNHRVWSPSKSDYVEAGSLAPGDDVSIIRMDIGMTPVQKQVLIGKMLGDGSLASGRWSASVHWNHRHEDAEYVEWTARGLGGLAHPTRSVRTSGYGTEMVRARTVSSALVKQEFDAWCAGESKQVPESVIGDIGPIALAFWYMDDGSLTHDEGQEDRAAFAVCGFNDASCDVLSKCLLKFGIVATRFEHDGYQRIRLHADEAEKFFLLVAPYIPPCMQRKLPERYRGHDGWLPPNGNGYKPLVVTQTVTSVEDANIKSERYDIETGTHNYFANGVLVHNCNARYVHHDERLFVASHHRWKDTYGESAWSRCARELDLATKLAPHPDMAVYGEVYGAVQDLKYGAAPGELRFRAFDVLDCKSRTYLDHADARSFLASVGIEAMPVLYEGPWSSDLVALAEGMSTLPGANCIREGFVVRPVHERRAHMGRVILKCIGEGYLTRKGA